MELFEGDKVRETMRTADVAVATYSADTVREYQSRGEHRERQDAYARGLAASGELADHFEPGVYDPEGRLSDEERAAAEKLAETDRAMVCVDDDSEITVRRSESDEGTATVFVALDEPTPEAVQEAIDEVAGQLDAEEGQLVVDGRLAGLTEEAARAGCDMALADGVRMPEQVHCVLEDERVYRWPPG